MQSSLHDQEGAHDALKTERTLRVRALSMRISILPAMIPFAYSLAATVLYFRLHDRGLAAAMDKGAED